MQEMDYRQRMLSRKQHEARQMSLHGSTNFGMTMDEIELKCMTQREKPPVPSTKPRPNYQRFIKTPLPTYLPPPVYGNKPLDPNHHYEELPSPAMVETMIASNNGHVRPPSNAPTETYDDARDSGCSQFSQPEADQQMMQLDRLDSGFSSFNGTRLPLTQQQLKPSVKQMNPRKKQNPLYEDFGVQPPGEKKVFVIDDDPKKPTSSSSSCCSSKLKCFRNNCLIPVVILCAVAAIVLVLLMVFGIVEQKEAGDAISDKIIGVQSTTINPSDWPTVDPSMSPEYLLEKILEQQDQLLALTQKINDLEKALSGEGDEELNTSDSTRITMNSNKIKDLERSLNDHTASANNRLDQLETSSDTIYGTIATLQRKQTDDDDAINAKVDSLDSMLTGRVDTLEANQIALTSRVTMLETSDVKFDVKLTSVNVTLTEEVDSVSKMMGPRGYNGSQGEQGPAGAGDLSQCVYDIAQHGSGSSTAITEVSMTPSPNDVVFGVTCSTKGGSNYILKVVNDPATPELKQYTCQCAGTNDPFDSTSTAARYCYLHYWKCPKTS